MDNWAIRQKVELTNSTDTPNPAYALASVGDKTAHTWSVEVLKDGKAADISGATVAGYFARPDGAAVIVKGRVEGSTAIVTMAQECYAIAGTVRAIVRISRNDQTVTLVTAIIAVGPNVPCQIIDPGKAIPNIDDLLTMATVTTRVTEEAIVATGKANEAAGKVNEAIGKANAAAQEASSAASIAIEAGKSAQGLFDALVSLMETEDWVAALVQIAGAVYCVWRGQYTVKASGWTWNQAKSRYEYVIKNTAITMNSDVQISVLGGMIGRAALDGGETSAGKVVLVSLREPREDYDILATVQRQGSGDITSAIGVVTASSDEPVPPTDLWLDTND